MFNSQAGQTGSRRWTYFSSALQLAVQRSAHKWTFEDFAECFPLYVKEDSSSASTTFQSISDYIESQSFGDLDKLLKEYNAQENVDTLHRIVNEAKERKATMDGKAGSDVWREDLPPRSAVGARTIPVLEGEAERLRKTVAEMESRNLRLKVELEASVNATDEAEKRTLELVAKLDSALEEWTKIPLDELEEWTVDMATQTAPTLRS
ncbi:hypothetical protein C8J56DRAFT_1157363 [Mycena floridula]|nr:hypothetical protein C8J56DRAFT_1157363 [Mycena floridula]